jgi:hypothetical protein
MAQPTKEQIQTSLLGVIETYYTGGLTAYLETCEAPSRVREYLGITDTKCPHQMITIALPKDYDLTKLHHKMCGVAYHNRTGVPKKWLIEAIASVEYFSKNHPDGGNLHIHLLKKGNYQKSKIIINLSAYYGVEPNFIDCKAGTYQEDYNNRRNYILGQKQLKDKIEYNILDKEWRKENGLMDIYEY